MVEEVTNPATHLTTVSHELFHASPFLDSLDEGVLPGIQLDSLDVVEGGFELISALVTNLVLAPPASFTPFSRVFIEYYLADNGGWEDKVSPADSVVESLGADEQHNESLDDLGAHPEKAPMTVDCSPEDVMELAS